MINNALRRLALCALLAFAPVVVAQEQANTPAAAADVPIYTIISTACEPGASDDALPAMRVRTQAGGRAQVWVRTLVLEGRGTCGALRAEEATENTRWRAWVPDVRVYLEQ